MGDCPGITFSLLAKVFAKGKMFWYPRPAARLTWILTSTLNGNKCGIHGEVQKIAVFTLSCKMDGQDMISTLNDEISVGK